MSYLLSVLKVLGLGWLILVVAVLVNIAAQAIGWRTWYDYFNLITEMGIKSATASLSPMEILFLFIIYPGILGLTVYLVYRNII